jgi:hypothetical protein
MNKNNLYLFLALILVTISSFIYDYFKIKEGYADLSNYNWIEILPDTDKEIVDNIFNTRNKIYYEIFDRFSTRPAVHVFFEDRMNNFLKNYQDATSKLNLYNADVTFDNYTAALKAQ